MKTGVVRNFLLPCLFLYMRALSTRVGNGEPKKFDDFLQVSLNRRQCFKKRGYRRLVELILGDLRWKVVKLFSCENFQTSARNDHMECGVNICPSCHLIVDSFSVVFYPSWLAANWHNFLLSYFFVVCTAQLSSFLFLSSMYSSGKTQMKLEPPSEATHAATFGGWEWDIGLHVLKACSEQWCQHIIYHII